MRFVSQVAPGPTVKKLILCSGKVKYDILEAREAAGLKEYVTVPRIRVRACIAKTCQNERGMILLVYVVAGAIFATRGRCDWCKILSWRANMH